MRVLFLTHSYPRWSGDAAGSFLLRLAQALGDQGTEVAVLAPAAPGLADHESVGGIPVTRFRYAPRTWETLAYTGNMAEDVRDSWTARLALIGFVSAGTAAALRLQREFAPDVIHAHWWFPAGIMGSLTTALSGRPLIVTMHGSDVRFAAALRPAQPLFRWVTSSARVVTTVSGWLARQAASIAPALAPVVAPMPAATELFDLQDAPRESASVLFVGRLNQQKGIARLIEALAKMSVPATLDVIGDGPDGPAARAQAMALGVAERIRWHGALPHHDLPDVYRRATVLAVPSIGEGLGMAAVEAQLCGTPVVAFDSGGIADTLRPGVSGLLVEAGDSNAFAAALDALVGAPARAATMGQAGRAWALATFSPGAVATHYAELYRVALSA